MSPETITTLKLEDVRPSPTHYRYRSIDKKNVEKLAAAIKVAGQLEPIRVWQDGDIYWIDSGHHRVAALKHLGAETVEAIVADTGQDDVTAATVMVASNLHIPETELEKSRGTQLLILTGVKPVDAAALTGEKADRVKKADRALKVINDPVAAEDMTLDRLEAISEFEDDSAAVAKLLNCTEAAWPNVYKQLSDDRTRAENVAKAKAIIEAAGCELIEVALGQSPEGLRYVGNGDAAPEGATHANIRTNAYWTDATVNWYRQATAEEDAPDPEAEARREQDALIKAELEKATVRRREFVRDHLKGETGGQSNALGDLAVSVFDGGRYFSAADEDDGPLFEVEGFLPRVYAALLATVDSGTQHLLDALRSGYSVDYYVREHGKKTVAYFEALAECGFTPTDAEAGMLVELAELLEEDVRADDCDDSEEETDE